MLISLGYSPSLQRLSVAVLRARGLQPLADAGKNPSYVSGAAVPRAGNAAPVCSPGVCVQVSLQIHAQVVKMKRSCVVKGENEPCFSHRMSFKLRPQHLDEACLRFELQRPNDVRSGETGSTFGFL